MSEFRFENTVTITESRYAELWSALPPRRLFGVSKVIPLAAVGILLLLTKYTLLFGVALLGLIVVLVLLPEKIFPVISRSIFRKHKYLRDANTYGVSQERLWIRSHNIEASVSWSMLVTWRETADLLVLSPSGIPPIYLSLARLREEGLYGRVRALAASNAPEYGTRPEW